jgi:hypothetical protein
MGGVHLVHCDLLPEHDHEVGDGGVRNWDPQRQPV